MNRLTVPLAAYLLPHRGDDPQYNGNVDIEMGIISTASHANEGSPTSESNPTELCRLLTIPPELRIIIYSFVLISTNKITWQGEYETKKPHPHAPVQKYACNKTQNPDPVTAQKPDSNIYALLLTCKTIHTEAVTTFYRRNDFVFKCRTPSTRRGLANISSPSSHSHALTSGLPHAFDNEIFRTHVQYIIFTCIYVNERDRYHSCGLENEGSDRIIGVGSRCPALKSLAILEPETNQGMRRAEFPGLTPRVIAGWWLYGVVLVCVMAGVYPKLPTDAPIGYPHIIDLDSLNHEFPDEQAISIADCVTTILFKFMPQALIAFLDLNSPNLHYIQAALS